MSGTGIVLRVARHSDQIDPRAWQALAGPQPFHDLRWLRLAERVVAQSEPRYVLAERDGQLIGAAVCAIDRHTNPAAWERNPIVRRIARLLRPLFPTLSCEIPIALLPGIVIAAGTAPSAPESALLAGMARVAADARARSIRIQHLQDAQSPPGLGTARAAEYRREPQLPNALLQVAWPAIAAWEAALSHQHRSEVRRIRRRAAEAGISVTPAAPGEEADPALRALIATVARRHSWRDPWADDLLSAARSVLGDDLTLLVARRAGRPVGCIATLRSGDEMVLKWPGLAATVEPGAFVYHSLMTAAVEHAIATGMRHLWLGPTAYPTKRDLGATLEPRACLVAERGSLAHRLTRAAGAHRVPRRAPS